MKRTAKGYTLIEILIVLAIIAILFTLGYANFREFGRRQVIVGAIRILRDDLRLAQEEALAGKKPTGCGGTLDGYRFNVVNSTSYEVVADCTTSDATVKQVTLPTGITINTPFPNPITFKALGQGTNIVSGQTAVLGLTQATTNNYKSIIVNANGNIEESFSTPTATVTATPTPSPVPQWYTLGSWAVGCNTTINFPVVTARQFRMQMIWGGGDDNHISFYGYGSTGAKWLVSGVWQDVTAQTGALNTGEWRETNIWNPTAVTTQYFSVGCNDGETMGVTVYYYN